jgi:glycosyltransferase involved in cell wall biosynthesis
MSAGLRESEAKSSLRTETGSELAEAIRSLQVAVEASNAQIRRLADAVETLLEGRVLPPAAAPARLIVADAARLHPAASTQRSINWVTGPKENLNWAYGNNAKRIADKLAGYEHVISSEGRADIAVYFDALIAERCAVRADKSVLRLGGPRPLQRLFGDDTAALGTFLGRFDAVVALSAELYLKASRLHPNVRFIPNALDLEWWTPIERDSSRPFTVGFAASMQSKAEIESKGYALAQEAVARSKVSLQVTTKGNRQIPHERMRTDFYSEIDVLLHPVAAGREGTSNVIMEALASGVPVITTPHAGFHGEFLLDRRTALIRDRDVEQLSEAIRLLRSDAGLRGRLRHEGRSFAERQHDINRAAQQYLEMFDALSIENDEGKRRRKVAFVPFWEPVSNFGSSRLRAQYPCSFLSKTGLFEVQLGYADDADVVVIVQMCSDTILGKLRENHHQFVIYDVCDKYYEKPRLFRHLQPPVDSSLRFRELSERADLILVPSKELKIEVASRLDGKAVKYVPEPVDYAAESRQALRQHRRVALWFGNPDRGNFESVRPLLERLRDQHGFEPCIVSRKSFFKAYPAFAPHVVEWSEAAMKEAFSVATLCVLAYDQDEQAKSANRFISAVMHGLPTIVWGSPACREILEGTGQHFAILTDPRSLDRAVEKLSHDDARRSFVERVQSHLTREHGEASITNCYVELLQRHTFSPAAFPPGARRRVGFVTHNLALGEGAPLSLFELVKGLRQRGVEPYVFSPVGGPLLDQYRAAGVLVEVFDEAARNGVKVLNHDMAAVRSAFTEFLRRHDIEALVCNTVKSSPYADFGRIEGIRSILIVRESYAADERFSFFQGEANFASIKGLTESNHVVFVAHSSRDAWADLSLAGDVHVIPNGIAAARFAGREKLTKVIAREALSLPVNDVVAVCVGSINQRKGQLQLLQAFARLPKAVRGLARIIFVGAGVGNRVVEFQSAVDGLPNEIRDRVTVVKAVEDVAPYYAAADISLMNSRSEAYPRTIVESLLWGLPVISTPVYGVREQLRQGKEGFLYEHDDMGSWSSHFSLLCLDPERRAHMAKEALRSFWRLTGYDEMLLAYQSLLADVLPRANAPADDSLPHAFAPRVAGHTHELSFGVEPRR